MRNLSIIAIAIAMMTACSGTASKKSAGIEGEVIALNKQSFLTNVFNYENNSDWVYEGTKPCIIDFYADWCAPCRIVSPILKELAATYKDEIIVYKIDVDAEEELAKHFNIEAIPTLYFIPTNGEPFHELGALSKAAITERIDRMLTAK